MTEAATPHDATVDEHGHVYRPLNAGQLNKLLSNLSPNRVSNRTAGGDGEGGRKLSYLEAWDVQRSLDVIFGFGGWSLRVLNAQILKFEGDLPIRNSDRKQFRAVAQVTVSLHIHQLHATYEAVAIASQSNPDPGEAADFAIKTADSDALKRAAKALGTQFGLSLYAKGAPMLDQVRSVLADGQRKIDIAEMQAHEAQTMPKRSAAVEEIRGQLGGPEPRAALTDDVTDDHVRVDEGADEGSTGAAPPSDEALEAARSTVQNGFAHPEAPKP